MSLSETFIDQAAALKEFKEKDAAPSNSCKTKKQKAKAKETKRKRKDSSKPVDYDSDESNVKPSTVTARRKGRKKKSRPITDEDSMSDASTRSETVSNNRVKRTNRRTTNIVNYTEQDSLLDVMDSVSSASKNRPKLASAKADDLSNESSRKSSKKRPAAPKEEADSSGPEISRSAANTKREKPTKSSTTNSQKRSESRGSKVKHRHVDTDVIDLVSNTPHSRASIDARLAAQEGKGQSTKQSSSKVKVVAKTENKTSSLLSSDEDRSDETPLRVNRRRRVAMLSDSSIDLSADLTLTPGVPSPSLSKST